jgi:hypothetical protein
MKWEIPAYIPQAFGDPVKYARLESKAEMGSYKAPEYLRCLLEFASICVIGGDPFYDLGSGEMEDKLRSIYRAVSGIKSKDPIALANKWAWSPMEGSTIVFDYEQLMTAVEALCLLIKTEDPINVVSRLAWAYADNESEEYEFISLGATLKLLGYSREIIENAAALITRTELSEIYRGYDEVV